MKVKYSSFLGILVALMLVASFVVPARLMSPEPVSAASEQSKMQWWTVDTPDNELGQTKNLYSPIWPTAAGTESGSELIKLLVGSNGTTMYVIYARTAVGTTALGPPPVSSLDDALFARVRFMKSNDGGRSWSGANYNNLVRDWLNPTTFSPGQYPKVCIWDMVIAPDNPNVVAVAASYVGNPVIAGEGINIHRVFISMDGGSNWENTQWAPAAPAPLPDTYISAMDISMDYGARSILVGCRRGVVTADNNMLWTMKMPGYGGWNAQNTDNGTPASINPFDGDIIAAKFSPTFNGDSTIVVIYANAVGTYMVTGVADIAKNTTTWQPAGTHVEIMRPTDSPNFSPNINEIITAMIQLPSDFSGQSASLRRVYVSTDSIGANGAVARGVFRIDDNIVYCLMDNTNTFYVAGVTTSRRAASIAYWGTYASGKLLVGERLGQACRAQVPVWFTDSPTTCPVPCWYPAKKPPTGAAGQTDCTSSTNYYGNAYVVWSPTFAAQGVAYATTGASSYDGAFLAYASPQTPAINWPAAIFNIRFLDESAFSLTRNNGETWNQLSLIDTRINKLTDVAPSPDCTTVYLASVNNGTYCQGFDSVWRSSTNEKVVAPPLPALPIGQVWERVYTHVTALTCTDVPQSNYAILRLAPDKLDGQVVGWAAGGTSGLSAIGGFGVGANTKAMAWSPDFGDYWADQNPRIPVQDFAFETSTILYVLSLDGNMQKMPYTGTAWSSTIQTVGTATAGGHTIEAMAPDKVLVGNAQTGASPNPASLSTNGGTSFVPMVRPMPNAATVGYHAIFDTDFVKNATIYVANDKTGYGLVYRNTAPAGSNVDWTDMMTNMCFIGYAGPHEAYFGLIQTNSLNATGQGTLYAAHDWQSQGGWSGVERTLTPLAGIPKPGLEWVCLDAAASPYQAQNVQFTLEPKSLKFCGCLTADTYTTLYAIDNDYYSDVHNVGKTTAWAGYNKGVRTIGLLWEYTDCVAKKGPKLTLDDGAIIGCDPATGRNQEVNFRWEQLCIATLYQLQIAKDKAFTLGVYDSSAPVCSSSGPFGVLPVDVTSPALVYFTGGGGTMPDTSDAAGTARRSEGWQPSVPALECGHLYYWRVRVLDEVTLDAVISPWSDVRNFTIKAGFRVTTPYYGPQLLSPDNGCACPCDTPIAFSWSPFKETTAYKIQISANADMSAPLEEDSNVISTAYMAKKAKFDCGKQYFWRVQAVKPAPSEWSASFAFSIQPRPAAPPTAPEPKEPTTPLWVWIVIAIGAILVIVTLVLIMKTRRA